MKAQLDNPFVRFHEQIEKYPDFQDNMDDVKLYEYDNFERMKPFTPLEKNVVGTTTVIPQQDTDEKLIWYDTMGESLYSNPLDTNNPTIDHGLEEESIWAFRMTPYNQDVIKNTVALDLEEQMKQSHAPFWGMKLAAPSFFNKDKFPRFYSQWQTRLQLEMLKAKHALQLAHTL